MMARKEMTLADVFGTVAIPDSVAAKNALERTQRLLAFIQHIPGDIIRVVEYRNQLGLMFDVDYQYLDNDEGISRQDVMNWWFDDANFGRMSGPPTQENVEQLVSTLFADHCSRWDSGNPTGMAAFFKTSGYCVSFRVFVPERQVLVPGSTLADDIHRELALIYDH
jgi:hypothetical protein